MKNTANLTVMHILVMVSIIHQLKNISCTVCVHRNIMFCTKFISPPETILDISSKALAKWNLSLNYTQFTRYKVINLSEIWLSRYWSCVLLFAQPTMVYQLISSWFVNIEVYYDIYVVYCRDWVGFKKSPITSSQINLLLRQTYRQLKQAITVKFC